MKKKGLYVHWSLYNASYYVCPEVVPKKPQALFRPRALLGLYKGLLGPPAECLAFLRPLIDFPPG